MPGEQTRSGELVGFVEELMAAVTTVRCRLSRRGCRTHLAPLLAMALAPHLAPPLAPPLAAGQAGRLLLTFTHCDTPHCAGYTYNVCLVKYVFSPVLSGVCHGMAQLLGSIIRLNYTHALHSF